MKILGILCYAVMMVGIGIWIVNGFLITFPRIKPYDPASGNIIPYNNHGNISYITPTQSHVDKFSPPIFIIFMFIGMAIQRKEARNRGEALRPFLGSRKRSGLK